VASLQMFLIVSTCVLYLVAAGLFSKAIWFFENHTWGKLIGGDASEVGSGPGSYDITKSVWHVNCCNPEINTSGWGLFNAILGWQNSATYGSVLSYNLYWITVIVAFVSMRYKEQRGHWPMMKASSKQVDSESSSQIGVTETMQKKASNEAATTTAVREIEE
jgi:high-affinity iron transporter